MVLSLETRDIKEATGSGRHFHLCSLWRIEADLGDTIAVLADTAGLPRWWGSSFLRAEVLEPGGEDYLGRVVRLLSKGFLPYTLQFMLRVDEVRPERWLRFAVRGDFQGSASIEVMRPRPPVELRFAWDVEVRHPLLAPLAGLGRPLLIRNHRWAMAGGERHLQAELDRRRGKGTAPPPPHPLFPHSHARFVNRLGWRPTVERWDV